MKQILIQLLAIVTLCNISCSKDRNDVTQSNNETFIVGKWEFIQSEDKGTRTTTNGKDTIIENINTTYTLMPNEYEHTTFEKNYNVVTNTFIEGHHKNYSGNYRINYNKVTINQTSQEDTYTIQAKIIELNSTTLKIEYDYKESIRPNITIKTIRTNTYKRIR